MFSAISAVRHTFPHFTESLHHLLDLLLLKWLTVISGTAACKVQSLGQSRSATVRTAPGTSWPQNTATKQDQPKHLPGTTSVPNNSHMKNLRINNKRRQEGRDACPGPTYPLPKMNRWSDQGDVCIQLRTEVTAVNTLVQRDRRDPHAPNSSLTTLVLITEEAI